MTHITIDVEDPGTLALWASVGDLVGRLPADWVLIGGLMVQLHALERGVRDVRVTADIDLLGQARPQGALQSINAVLISDGFTLTGPDLDGYAYRYTRGELVVDVLAPDGITPPVTIGGLKAVGVPGGTQALGRAEVVTVRIGDREFSLRRPSLIGAILMKARSLMKHADPDSQREDLLRLLAMVEDPRALATELRPTERRWLRNAETRLAFDSFSSLDEAIVRRARQAHRILIG